jgi:hypothetical protein
LIFAPFSFWTIAAMVPMVLIVVSVLEVFVAVVVWYSLVQFSVVVPVVEVFFLVLLSVLEQLFEIEYLELILPC